MTQTIEGSWTEGFEFPPQVLGPITRSMIALYAGGSNDHNPLHLDPAFAKAAGLPDVIGQGMLTMALLGRYVTAIVPQRSLATFAMRFMAMAQVGDALHCAARVASLRTDDAGGRTAGLELTVSRSSGEVLAAGEASVRIAS